MAQYQPPVGFHFKVEVLGLSAGADDARFSEVSGLAVEFGVEEVAEGGENRFIQKYPTRAKYADLALKRGFLLGSSLQEWVRSCLEDYVITPKDIDVKLLDEEHQPLVTWHVAKAYPTKWSCSDLNASNNAVMIESMQFFYQRFTMDKG